MGLSATVRICCQKEIRNERKETFGRRRDQEVRYRTAWLGDSLGNHQQLARLLLHALRYARQSGDDRLHHPGHSVRRSHGHRYYHGMRASPRRLHRSVYRLQVRFARKSARAKDTFYEEGGCAFCRNDRLRVRHSGNIERGGEQCPSLRMPDAFLCDVVALLHALQCAHPRARSYAGAARQPLDLHLGNLLRGYCGRLPRYRVGGNP